MRERIAEDRKALALAGRAPVNLEFLDGQYRDSDQALAPITVGIREHLAPGTHLYAPAAFADHVDHALVRAAALDLAREGFAVSLYADLPHATHHGWPAWVGGSPDAVGDDLAGALWERRLAETGVPPGSMSPTVVELDEEARAQKLAAVRAYETQLTGLVELAGRQLSDPQTFRHEVAWTLPGAATRSSTHAVHRAGSRR